MNKTTQSDQEDTAELKRILDFLRPTKDNLITVFFGGSKGRKKCEIAQLAPAWGALTWDGKEFRVKRDVRRHDLITHFGALVCLRDELATMQHDLTRLAEMILAFKKEKDAFIEGDSGYETRQWPDDDRGDSASD